MVILFQASVQVDTDIIAQPGYVLAARAETAPNIKAAPLMCSHYERDLLVTLFHQFNLLVTII